MLELKRYMEKADRIFGFVSKLISRIVNQFFGKWIRIIEWKHALPILFRLGLLNYREMSGWRTTIGSCNLIKGILCCYFLWNDCKRTERINCGITKVLTNSCVITFDSIILTLRIRKCSFWYKVVVWFSDESIVFQTELMNV